MRPPPLGVLALVVALGLALLAPSARASDPSAPPPPAEVAGKPPAWWARELASPRTRAVAREALRVLGEPGLLAAVRALADDDPALRSAAAAEVDALRGDPAPELPSLRKALEAPEPDVRAAAARLAVRTGLRGVPLQPALVALRSDLTKGTRAAVVRALAATGARSSEAFTLYAGELRGDDPSAVEAARGVFEGLGPESPAAVPAITGELVRSPSASGAETLIRALGRIGGDAPGVLEALRAARERGNSVLRREAIAAIARCAASSPAALAEFRAMVEPAAPDRVLALRQAAAIPALARALPDAYVAALLDADTQVASSAQEALAAVQGPVDDFVSRMIAAGTGAGGAGAFDVLLRSWGARALPAAAAGFSNAQPETRLRLLRFFQGIGSPDRAPLVRHADRIVPVLREVLTSADTPADVRRDHAALLASLAQEDTAAAVALLDVVDRIDDASLTMQAMRSAHMLRGTLFDRLRDERESVRRRALDLLSQGSLGSAEAPILARCLGDPAPSVRARAALALMRGGGPFNRRGNRPEPIVAPSALVSALVDGLRDEQESVRVQAAQSLGSLGSLGDPVRDALPALAESLSDEPVRITAANSVGRLVVELKVPVLSVLGPAMESAAGATRAAAARALAASGRRAEAVALLRPLLDDVLSVVRVAALQAAATIGPDANSLAPLVEALQSDRDPTVAQAARSTLAAFRPK